MQPPPVRRRNTRLVVVGSALLGLLALVAFASRSGFEGHSSNAAPSQGFADWAFSVFLVLFVLAVPLTVVGYLSSGGELIRSRRRSFRERVMQQLAGVTIVLLAITLIVYLRNHHSGGLHLNLSALRGVQHDTHAGTVTAHRAPTFKWPVAFIAGVICLALGFGWYSARRRLRNATRLPFALDDRAFAADVAGTIDEAIDDLEAEPDARRAVIAAYARMESVLGRHGLRREPSETPLEYLRRVLLGLTARGDAVQSLTQLFEEARFSRHEIDATMKSEAIGALRTIRDDLQSAAA
jgi:Domain of unknown function (DUF4129)